MKKAVSVFLIIAFALLLPAACAPKTPEPAVNTPDPTQSTPEQTPKSVSMFDLSEALCKACEGSELVYASSSDADAAGEFAYVSDLDYEKVESFMMLYAPDGNVSPEEIVVICLSDEADAPLAEQSLRAHVKSRSALYSSYKPEFVNAVEAAEVFTRDRFAVLIISEHAEAVRTAFDDFIG